VEQGGCGGFDFGTLAVAGVFEYVESRLGLAMRAR